MAKYVLSASTNTVFNICVIAEVTSEHIAVVAIISTVSEHALFKLSWQPSLSIK